jgi:prepilin peptidase CpaA
MGFRLQPIDLVLVAVLLIALYTDIVHGKIYNKVTFPCIGLGLALNIYQAGWNGAVISLEGIALGLGVFVVIALLRLMSGGDAKLLWAIGSLKGWEFLLWTLLFMALAGGVLAICFMIYRKVAKETLADVGSRTYARMILGAPIEWMPTLRAGKLPYSIAISAGVLVAYIRMGGIKPGM